jgi:hypothetical membrane protein
MANSKLKSIKNIGRRSDRAVKVFNDRYPYLGPLFWIMSVQYLSVQWVVASRWPYPPGYSWLHNAISDLGNTACGPYYGRYVCSPDHLPMNMSFIVLGLTMVAGSWLIYHEFLRNRFSCYGFIGMAIAGLGAILVGASPENVNGTVHYIGAILAFGVGDIALVLLALTISMGWQIRGYTLLSGIAGLTGLALYATHHYFGLGLGGMERLAGYPQTIWLIVFGIYMSRNHYQRLQRKFAKAQT